MPNDFSDNGANSFDEFLSRYLAGERARQTRSIDLSRFLTARTQEILQNAGEGILPDLSRGDDYGMQDLLTSYRWAAFERMSTEAQENAADWIKRTSGYDPNLVISQGKKVDMDTSGRSILDSTASYVDTTAAAASP